MLLMEAGKPRRQKWMIRQRRVGLVALGYERSHSRLAAFVRE
jgi:hypothetical protein